ncbi:MAG: S8 family serine peptidase [Phycisphaerae bacterium]|nr:S53 family peptidase [Tepidisphaeraceae bacterium]
MSETDTLIQSLEPRVLMAATPDGFTPAQMRRAYGFEQVAFLGKGGGRNTADGRGQTIAVVTAYRAPNVANDLKVFNQQFDLPNTDLTGAPIFSQVTMRDSRGRLPRVDTAWAGEAAMDVEWAHAIAPRAKILHVEAISDDIEDLLDAVDYARRQPGVTVVSMSWGTEEFFGQTDYEPYFVTPKRHIGGAGMRGGVSFVASSGDDGIDATWPATSPSVLAVGGTTLDLGPDDYWRSETGWGSSGGGLSKIDNSPSPDVSYNANPITGYSVYDSSEGEGWYTVAGTSAGAPQWAALVALVNQGRGARGLGSLESKGTIDALFKVPFSDFHDITSGNNGHRAKPGYDLVTGLGTPIAQRLIPDMVLYGTKTFGRVLAAAAAERKPAANTAYPFAASASVSTTPLAASPLVATAWVGDFVGSRGARGSVFADELIETNVGAV